MENYCCTLSFNDDIIASQLCFSFETMNYPTAIITGTRETDVPKRWRLKGHSCRLAISGFALEAEIVRSIKLNFP